MDEQDSKSSHTHTHTHKAVVGLESPFICVCVCVCVWGASADMTHGSDLQSRPVVPAEASGAAGGIIEGEEIWQRSAEEEEDGRRAAWSSSVFVSLPRVLMNDDAQS